MFLDQAIITLLKRITAHGEGNKREKVANRLYTLCSIHRVAFFYENSKWKRFKIVKIFNTVYLNIVSVRKLKLRCSKCEREREREWKFPFDHHISLVNITRAPLAFKLLHAQTHAHTHSHVIIAGALNSSNEHWTQHGRNHTKYTIILTGGIAKQRKRSVVDAQALVNSNNDSSRSSSYFGTTIACCYSAHSVHRWATKCRRQQARARGRVWGQAKRYM